MTRELQFECLECGEEFVFSETSFEDPEHLLLCPVCGNVEIELVADRVVWQPPARTAA